MHAIVIPHRDRNRFLKWCLLSIQASEEVTGIEDYVVIVVDGGSKKLPLECMFSRQRVTVLERHLGWEFNKSWLLNIGIDTAISLHQADVITFLDADAIVGPRWLEAVDCLEAPSLTRLCYRVKLLWLEDFEKMEPYAENAGSEIRGQFLKWHKRLVGPEIWDDPRNIVLADGAPGPDGRRRPPFGPHVFGNSQFSIRRDVLGDLRCNENFRGRGFEDQWLIREIWRRAGESYCALLLTDPDYAIYVVTNEEGYQNTPGDGWDTDEAMERNRRIFKST